MHPFLTFDITPNYALGFAFNWTLSKGFSDPNPLAWSFVVQESGFVNGPWTTISPVLQNVRYWAESTDPDDPAPRVVNKDHILHFRVALNTPAKTYYSDVRTPYGDVDRYEWLYLREAMRQEQLRMVKMSGVRCAYWSEAVYGPACTVCTHPITGDSLRTGCDVCYGTGIVPGYFGPYECWAVFSPSQRQTKQGENGTKQDRTFSVRLLGYPYAKHGDIIVDLESNKRYHVDVVQSLFELRRVSAIQQVSANELPISDPVYKLGTGVTVDPCIMNENE